MQDLGSSVFSLPVDAYPKQGEHQLHGVDALEIEKNVECVIFETIVRDIKDMEGVYNIIGYLKTLKPSIVFIVPIYVSNEHVWQPLEIRDDVTIQYIVILDGEQWVSDNPKEPLEHSNLVQFAQTMDSISLCHSPNDLSSTLPRLRISPHYNAKESAVGFRALTLLCPGPRSFGRAINIIKDARSTVHNKFVLSEITSNSTVSMMQLVGDDKKLYHRLIIEQHTPLTENIETLNAIRFVTLNTAHTGNRVEIWIFEMEKNFAFELMRHSLETLPGLESNSFMFRTSYTYNTDDTADVPELFNNFSSVSVEFSFPVRISDETTCYFRWCRNLKSLTVTNVEIDWHGFNWIKENFIDGKSDDDALQFLSLEYNGLDDAAVDGLKSIIGDLEHLNYSVGEPLERNKTGVILLKIPDDDMRSANNGDDVDAMEISASEVAHKLGKAAYKATNAAGHAAYRAGNVAAHAAYGAAAPVLEGLGSTGAEAVKGVYKTAKEAGKSAIHSGAAADAKLVERRREKEERGAAAAKEARPTAEVTQARARRPRTRITVTRSGKKQPTKTKTIVYRGGEDNEEEMEEELRRMGLH